MKYEYYNPVDEKGGCVVRSISKALNKEYEKVKKELILLANKLNKQDYRDDSVFEKYLLENGFSIIDDYNNKIVQDCEFNGRYIVFGNKEDWYHLVTIIDNIIYDKNENGKELKIIKAYKCSTIK